MIVSKITTTELKGILDLHISKVSDLNMKIIVNKAYYEKARYSCTIDEKDFHINKGRVYYKGFELKHL